MKSNLLAALVSLMLFCLPVLASVSNTNSDDAVGDRLYIKHGDNFTYAISGTFTGKVKIERLINSGWELVVSTTNATASGGIEVLTPNKQPTFYRCRWYDYVGGASTCTLTDANAHVPDDKILKNSLGEVVGSITEYGLDIQSLTVTTGATVAKFLAGSGTAAAPSVAFAADDDTGLYRIGANNMGFSANGTAVGNISAAGLWTIGPVSGTSTHVVYGQSLRLNYATAGNNVILQARHSDNTNAASHAVLYLETGGGSGGDPKTQYFVGGGQDWATGIDNSDSDSFVISNSANLGTNNAMRVGTDRIVGFPAGVKNLVSTANTANPPTNAELISAFGAAATVGAGFTALLDDNNGHAAEYIIWSDGTKYWYAAGTAAP